MKQSPSASQPLLVRTPYFFQDPIRASAIVCALLLMFLPDVPFTLALFAIGISQVNSIAMVIDIVGTGWTERWGRRARTTVMTNTLAIDWANTSVCTLVGAMLLIRLFGPGQLVTALGCMTLAIALLPDIRFCRILLPSDAHEANAVLERGYFFRDPIKIGAICAMAIICALDRTSLAFVCISMGLMQLNSILVFVDKYLTEVEVRRDHAWIPSRTIRLVLARDGQRLLLTLMPLAMVPLRLGTEDAVARWTAIVIAAFIIVPDVLRFVFRLIGGMLGFASASPARA